MPTLDTVLESARNTMKLVARLSCFYVGINFVHLPAVNQDDQDIGRYCTVIKHHADAGFFHKYGFAFSHLLYELRDSEPIFHPIECGEREENEYDKTPDYDFRQA